MSTEYWSYLLISYLTGNPILAIVIVLAGTWLAGRVTLPNFPDPIRWTRRWLKMGRLRSAIEHNPHDRRNRFELADILIGQRRYRAALEVLRPNIEAGDEDATTLYLMGIACLGSGHAGQGEAFLTHAEEADPKFRLGAIDLERGRWRLARGDHKGAIEALSRFIQQRKGTVEGRVLMARALAGSGDDATGAMVREEAWKEYVTAPRFQRRVERFWAWRAKPSRPIAYAALALIGVFLFSRFVGPAISDASTSYSRSYGGYGPGVYGGGNYSSSGSSAVGSPAAGQQQAQDEAP